MKKKKNVAIKLFRGGEKEIRLKRKKDHVKNIDLESF